MKISPDSTESVVAKIDRVVLSSASTLESALAALGDFRTASDHGLRNLNEGFFTKPYGRRRELVNDRTKTRLFVCYRPRFVNMAPLRVAVTPDDIPGLQRRELEAILQAFRPYRLRKLEFALDFPWRTRR